MSEFESFDFDQVLNREIPEIVERRIAVGKIEGSSSPHVEKDELQKLEQSVREELVGVALSGGGVRAGATGLGLLQAFHDNKLMEDVDYLSTVSGGSYAGAFLSSDAVSNERHMTHRSAENGDSPSQLESRKTSKRMLQFVFGGEYLRDTVGFLNRQLFGMVLVALVVFSALTAVAALLSVIARSLDYQPPRSFSRALGFESEISLAMLPALICFFAWLSMWGWAYLRRDSDRPKNVARYSFYLLILFFLIGIANILGTGSLWLGTNGGTFDLRHVWGYLAAAIGASLLPYISPKMLIKSGTQPRNVSERYFFWVATNGLLYGIPFLFIGYLLQENISGVNEDRSGKIVASSEIKGWGPGTTYNRLWIDVLANEETYPADSWKPRASENPSVVIADNFEKTLKDVKENKDLKINAENISLTSLFEKLEQINGEYKLQMQDSLAKVYAELVLWPDSESPFRKRFRTRTQHSMIKNVLADWLGNQMRKPTFCFDLNALTERVPSEARPRLCGIEDYRVELSKKDKKTEEDKELMVLLSRLEKFSETRNSDSEEKIRIIEDINRELLVNLYPDNVQPQSTVKSFVCLENDQQYRWNVFLYSTGIFLVLSVVVNLNKTSCHSFYRNRLAEMWIEKGAGFDGIPMPQVETTKRGYPYHLILGSLAFFGSFDRKKSPERIDHFLFSRLHCGSERTGFIDTSKYMKGGLTLQDAVAISGAAISVVHIKNSLIMFLLFITNLRLGQWLENPRFSHRWENSSWSNLIRYFLVTPMGMLLNLHKLADNRPNVFVADGGHFENLAIDDLLRRRCRLIFALDAGADPELKMEDLTRLVRSSRMRHGIQLIPIFETGEKQLTDSEFVEQLESQFSPAENKDINWANTNYLLWKIEYPSTIDLQGNEVRTAPGVLVYMKNTMTGEEPLELVKYQADNKAFPHDTTTDQFFDSDKFESYRQLGNFSGNKAIQDIRTRFLTGGFDQDDEVRESLSLANTLVSANRSDFDSRHLLETYFKQLKNAKSTNQKRNLMAQLQGLNLDHQSAISLFQLCKDENDEIRKIATNMLIDESECCNASLLLQLLDDDCIGCPKVEEFQSSEDSTQKQNLRRELLIYFIESYNRNTFPSQLSKEIQSIVEKNRDVIGEEVELQIFDLRINSPAEESLNQSK